MASLPPEIWLHIIEWLDYDKSIGTGDYTALENLSVVSSSFRSMTQPLIFKDLTITIRRDSSEKIENRLEGLLELFETRPESARGIKSFFCTDRAKRTAYLYGANPSPIDEDKFHNLIASLFVRLPALTYISLSSIKITLPMLSHIHQLPNLCAVDLDSVDLPPPREFWEECAGQAVSTSISDLSIDGTEAHPAVTGLMSIPTIRTLSLGGPGSMQLILDVVQARPSFTFHDLSSLNLSFEPAFNSLFDHPTLFSNLTSLDIFCSLHGRDTFPIPNTSALKTLKQFGGPLVFAAFILPGRPVNDVYIHSADKPHVLSVGMLSSLNTSQSVLRRLSVRSCAWSNGCLALIGELFPGLEYLGLFEIVGNYMRWLADRLSYEIQGLSHLQTLALTTAHSSSSQNVSRGVQERMLNKLGSSAPPNLRSAQLGGTTWRADDQGHWAQMF